MSVKKTGSPFSRKIESQESLTSKDVNRTTKTEGGFEAVLYEVEGQLGQSIKTESVERSALSQIAVEAHLDSPEGAFGAVKKSAGLLIQTRLADRFAKSENGVKLTEEISDFIARDPFMHRKILDILQKLK